MKFAYADPPYVGCCARYGHFHPDNLCWDDMETTKRLIETLNKCYDGWALAKPPGFNAWIIELLGVRAGIDVLHDVFPGTGGMEVAQVKAGTLTFTTEVKEVPDGS